MAFHFVGSHQVKTVVVPVKPLGIKRLLAAQKYSQEVLF